MGVDRKLNIFLLRFGALFRAQLMEHSCAVGVDLVFVELGMISKNSLPFQKRTQPDCSLSTT